MNLRNKEATLDWATLAQFRDTVLELVLPDEFRLSFERCLVLQSSYDTAGWPRWRTWCASTWGPRWWTRLRGSQVCASSSWVRVCDVEFLALDNTLRTRLTALSVTNLEYDPARRAALAAQLCAFASLRSLAVPRAKMSHLVFVSPMATSLQQLHLPRSFDLSLAPLRSCLRLPSLTIAIVEIGLDRPNGERLEVASLVQLRHLLVGGGGVDTLRPLEKLIQMEELTIASGRASDVAPLAKMRQLRALTLTGLPLTSVQALTNLVALDRVVLEAINVADLRPLGTLTQLTQLTLNANDVATDFDFVRHSVALEELELMGNALLTSVALCADLLQLKALRVSHNAEMVRSLRALPQAKGMDIQI